MPAFKSMFSSLLSGNLREAANYAFIDQQTVDTLEANKSQLEQNIIRLESEGTINNDQRDKLLNDISDTAFPRAHKLTGSGDPVSVFSEGIRSDVGKTINAIALAVPWQIYVVALLLGAVFIAPTLLPYLAKFLKK